MPVQPLERLGRVAAQVVQLSQSPQPASATLKIRPNPDTNFENRYQTFSRCMKFNVQTFYKLNTNIFQTHTNLCQTMPKLIQTVHKRFTNLYQTFVKPVKLVSNLSLLLALASALKLDLATAYLIPWCHGRVRSRCFGGKVDVWAHTKHVVTPLLRRV